MLTGYVPTALDLSAGCVAFGRRTTSSSVSTTAEVGVLRLDGISVYSGRRYKITTSPLNMFSTVSGDLMNAHIRVSTSGVATTSSTQLTGLVESAFSAAASQRTQGLNITYTPGLTGTLSVLLSISRDGGTGNVSINASAIYPADLVVEDIGPDPASTVTIL